MPIGRNKERKEIGEQYQMGETRAKPSPMRRKWVWLVMYQIARNDKASVTASARLAAEAVFGMLEDC